MSFVFVFVPADQLNKRDIRAARLLALAEVVKLVERATSSLESAALGCFGIDRYCSGGVMVVVMGLVVVVVVVMVKSVMVGSDGFGGFG